MKKIPLITTVFLLSFSSLIWAIDTRETGYRATSTTKEITDLDENYDITENDQVSIERQGQLDEFVPTRTPTEWASYKTRASITPSCTPQTEKRCHNGDIYWYNSCGEREDLFEECTEKACNDPTENSCPTPPSCYPSTGVVYPRNSSQCGARCSVHGNTIQCANNELCRYLTYAHSECSWTPNCYTSSGQCGTGCSTWSSLIPCSERNRCRGCSPNDTCYMDRNSDCSFSYRCLGTNSCASTPQPCTQVINTTHGCFHRCPRNSCGNGKHCEIIYYGPTSRQQPTCEPSYRCVDDPDNCTFTYSK